MKIDITGTEISTLIASHLDAAKKLVLKNFPVGTHITRANDLLRMIDPAELEIPPADEE